MTLRRGKIIGYDLARMFFVFSMLDGDREVRCEISSIALNDLAGTRNAPNRQDQFCNHRDEIEATAAEIFDQDAASSLIRIFGKHVKFSQKSDTNVF
jgi:hypothetical protein